MLHSLYNDTSSEASQVNTPKRVTTHSASNTGRKPFQSPLKTPLRSPISQSPIIKQYQATSAFMQRVFTSNFLFRFTAIFLPIVVSLLVSKLIPYAKTGRCPANWHRHMYYCIDPIAEPERMIHINVSNIITSIVRKFHPKTFDQMYEKFEIDEDKFKAEKDLNFTFDYDFVLDSVEYCTDVAMVNGRLVFKLADQTEIIILFILLVLNTSLLITCCIFRYRQTK
ncbi:hypothetical protein TRFO_33408 [Tritrichomonas foetus]|uniref:Uncharacterized protein n=1 Tax=Tritrichomonas foetus TaxID=1144522 RepID=A0A1J4JNL0_9EUKA|nr:hypothetical protein TRFO_33408 [Tritrichomonas foetus]|eukprot:OHT00024.1 hypothetical protein TRFO_33408 [Tritrichomonas foetus]